MNLGRECADRQACRPRLLSTIPQPPLRRRPVADTFQSSTPALVWVTKASRDEECRDQQDNNAGGVHMVAHACSVGVRPRVAAALCPAVACRRRGRRRRVTKRCTAAERSAAGRRHRDRRHARRLHPFCREERAHDGGGLQQAASGHAWVHICREGRIYGRGGVTKNGQDGEGVGTGGAEVSRVGRDHKDVWEWHARGARRVTLPLRALPLQFMLPAQSNQPHFTAV